MLRTESSRRRVVAPVGDEIARLPELSLGWYQRKPPTHAGETMSKKRQGRSVYNVSCPVPQAPVIVAPARPALTHVKWANGMIQERRETAEGRRRKSVTVQGVASHSDPKSSAAGANRLPDETHLRCSRREEWVRRLGASPMCIRPVARGQPWSQRLSPPR